MPTKTLRKRSTPESLEPALAHHRAGRLAKAEAGYREILQFEPQHPDALHLLGVIAQQMGHYDDAIQLIRAIRNNPKAADYRTSLGSTYQLQGKLDAAAASYRNAGARSRLSRGAQQSRRSATAAGRFVRGRFSRNTTSQTFQSSRDNLSILDYGGGNGVLARVLTKAGFRAATYDPFTIFFARPQGRFDLITCFEVLEHSPFPDRTVSDMSRLLADEGIILCSTLTQPSNFDQLGLGWWYAGPRNGHVSLYSRRSLTILFQKHSRSRARREAGQPDYSDRFPFNLGRHSPR
jgi:SAM-dependent methyltransferase